VENCWGLGMGVQGGAGEKRGSEAEEARPAFER
jgi:hypothetical protein